LSNVYSTRFILDKSGSLSTYTVPAGYRAVVKCITGLNTSSSAVAELQVVANPGSVVVVFENLPAYGRVIGTNGFVWFGMIVLNPGDSLRNASDATVDVSASGFLLLLP
jgi:hypothetical protein